MKRNTISISLLFLLFSSVCFSQAVDTNFYNYGWVKMMDSGEDFRSIKDAGETFYADTAKRSKTYNFHHYGRWLTYWKNRTYSSTEDISSGKSGGMFYHHAQRKAALFNTNICSNNHPASNWESWGFDTHPSYRGGSPHSYGGMGVMWTVVADTSDHSLQTLYAGSPLGGIWKSDNQGNNWYNISDQTNLPSMSISHIAINPHNNQHLLVATGVNWGINPPGIGVIESKDAGQTWTVTGLQNNPQTPRIGIKKVSKVYFHPTDTNKFFAAVNHKLMLTLNQGATWDSILPIHIPDTHQIENVRFHPTNPDIIYCSTEGAVAALYKSTNGGSTWTNITSNFYNGTATVKEIQIDVNAVNPNKLYAGLRLSTSHYQFYVSTDMGSTSTLKSDLVFSTDKHPNDTKGWMMVSPTDDNYVIISGISIFHSTDGGTSYSLITGSASGGYHGDIRGGSWVNGLAMLATDGGISISTSSNLGGVWSNRYNGLNVQQCFGHDVDDNFTYLLTGLQDVGGYHYDIANQIWTQTYGSDGGIPYIFNQVSPTEALANQFCGVEQCNFEVYHYYNDGQNSAGTNRMPVQWHSPHGRPFVAQPNGTVFTGMQSIYTTDYAGTSYTKYIDFEALGIKGDSINDFIVAIANTPADTNIMAVGFGGASYGRDENKQPCYSPTCVQKKLLISKDGGATWVDRTAGLNPTAPNNLVLPIHSAPIADVIISPHDAGKIWVVCGSYAEWNGLIYKIYFSPDTGNTWQNISYNLPNFAAHSIVYQPNSNDRLYLATDVGVFTIDGSSTNWECYNNNLPATFCVDLDVNNCGGALTVSGHGRGIWKSPLAPNRLVGNVLWDGHRTVGSDIIVQDTLTITGTVEMASNTKITVEVGGKLIVDGGTISSSHCTNDLWQGIELLGNSSANQYGEPMSANYPQGYVQLTNGATLENAVVGIHAGSLSKNGFSGGRIHMAGDLTQIKNCKTGILIQAYAKHSLNSFTNVNFLNDGSKIDPATNAPLVTGTHVEIRGMSVVGNEFNGVDFKNTNPNASPSERGQGIHLTGRRIGTTNNPFVSNCHFEKLQYGLRCGNLASGVGNDIEENTFLQNDRAIYVATGFSLEIKDNSFQLPDEVMNEDVYAIMTTQLSQFDIRNNSIQGSAFPANGSGRPMGIIIENSNSGGGVLFNNQIGLNQEMDICIQAQGNNENLTIRCNEMEYRGNSNTHGLTVLDYWVVLNGQILANVPAELRDQGHPNCLSQGQQTGDDKAAAGNKWLPACAGNDEEILMSNGVVFKYYWHSLSFRGTPITEPNCSDPTWNTNPNLYIDCQLNESNSSCDDLYTPPTGGGGGEEGGEEGFFRKKNPSQKSGADSIDLAAHKAWYLRLQAKQHAIAARANGSQSATALIASLNSTAPSLMQAQLMAASPLSKEVLLACIQQWAGTENTALKSVLKVNLPLEKSIWTRLHQQGLSALWMGELGTAHYPHLLRDSLERIDRSLRFAKKEWQLAEAKYYRQQMADSSFKAAEEALDTSMLSASLRLLAKDFIHRGDYLKANALLTRINSHTVDGELIQNQDFVAYYTALMPFYQQGKSSVEGEMDAVALQPVMALNQHLGGEAEVFYENLTRQFNHHPIVRKASNSLNQPILASLNQELKSFTLFPNPNQGAATLAYELAGETAALWQVFDINGKLLHEMSLPVGAQQKQFKMSGLPNGVYHFVVSLKEERLFNGKMVVTKP